MFFCALKKRSYLLERSDACEFSHCCTLSMIVDAVSGVCDGMKASESRVELCTLLKNLWRDNRVLLRKFYAKIERFLKNRKPLWKNIWTCLIF